MTESIHAQLQSAADDLLAWKKGEMCVVFPLITDLHSNLMDADGLFSMERDVTGHVSLLNELAALSGADFEADLGDEGFEYPVRDPEQASELVRRLRTQAERSPVPFLHCVGNHDLFFPEHTKAFWGKILKEINGDKGRFTTGPDGEYGFLELAEKHCRVFFLNTSDSGEAGFSGTQLDFLKHHLQTLPEDWVTLVLTHICPRSRACWLSDQPPARETDRFPAFTKILREFRERGGVLAGVFSGDSHYDYFDCEDRINYFVTQGCGGITEGKCPPHARVFREYSERLKRAETFDSRRTCLIDLVAVKLRTREVRVFRAGAGGRSFHRGAAF